MKLGASKCAEFDDDVHLSCSWPELHFVGKLGLKNHNCLFKMKLRNYTNSKLNSNGDVHTFCFEHEFHFLGKFGQKNYVYLG